MQSNHFSSCNNFETVGAGCQLVLGSNFALLRRNGLSPITLCYTCDRKSYSGFLLVPTSMTLYGIIAPALRYFIEFDRLGG